MSRYVFDEQGAEKIARAVRHVLGRPLLPDPPRRRWPVGGGGGAPTFRGVAGASGVPAAGSGGDGSATATVTWADGSASATTVYNSLRVAVPANANLRLAYEATPSGPKLMCLSWDGC